jgi:TonB family protein
MKLFLIAAWCVMLAIAAPAQDLLDEARNLYASAAYEDALAVLNRLDKATPVTEQADQYRAFCLFALGRTAEAKAVAEALVQKNPFIEVDGDASPRIVAMFTSTRQQMLPALIREKYRVARVSLDQKDFGRAQPELESVQRMLDESAKLGAADASMSDLRVLVDGFLNLIQTTTALAKPAAPLAAAAATVAPAGEPPLPDALVRRSIYTTGAADVVPPIVLRQNVPPIPAELRLAMASGPNTGIVEVLIDEQGNVADVIMREPVHPVYDRLVRLAARKWKYRPAQKGQVPVKFVKRIAIVINPERTVRPSPDSQSQP